MLFNGVIVTVNIYVLQIKPDKLPSWTGGEFISYLLPRRKILLFHRVLFQEFIRGVEA
jgi:hypothetical protein